VRVCHPGLPVQGTKELIDHRRAKGPSNTASARIGPASHLAGIAFQTAAGLQSPHVPYKCGQPGHRAGGVGRDRPGADAGAGGVVDRPAGVFDVASRMSSGGRAARSTRRCRISLRRRDRAKRRRRTSKLRCAVRRP